MQVERAKHQHQTISMRYQMEVQTAMMTSLTTQAINAAFFIQGAVSGLGLPSPDLLISATAPAAPKGMRETSRAARLTPIHYSNPLVANSIKDPRILNSTAALCILGWSYNSPTYKYPGNIRVMWGVYDSVASAKMGALSRTWGQRAVPPKPSLSSGSLSGRPLGEESWHSSEGSPVTVITRRGKVVVQVLIQPAGKLVGKGITFEKIKNKDLQLIESIARETLKKTDLYVRGH